MANGTNKRAFASVLLAWAVVIAGAGCRPDIGEIGEESQPIMASAGCTFKNPDAIPAGRLIDLL